MSEPQSVVIELTAETAAKIATGLEALPELRDRRVYEQEERNRQATALRAEIVKLTAPLLALERQVQMKAMPEQERSTIRQAWSTPIDVASLARTFDWPTNIKLNDLERDQRDLPIGSSVGQNEVHATSAWVRRPCPTACICTGTSTGVG